MHREHNVYATIFLFVFLGLVRWMPGRQMHRIAFDHKQNTKERCNQEQSGNHDSQILSLQSSHLPKYLSASCASQNVYSSKFLSTYIPDHHAFQAYLHIRNLARSTYSEISAELSAAKPADTAIISSLHIKYSRGAAHCAIYDSLNKPLSFCKLLSYV